MSSQEFEGLGGGADSGRSGGGALGETSGRATEGLGDEVAGYAAEVRAQFADLSAQESADLLEDLEDHLREVAAEGAGTLRQRLGAPAAYARELRQAAGLPEPGEGNGSGGARQPGGAVSWWRVLRTSLRNVVADVERRIRVNPAGAAVLDFLPSLRPAWWVLRAWVVVRALQVWTTYVNTWQDFSLIPRVNDSTTVGMLALLVAIPLSVYLGRRNYSGGWPRGLMLLGQCVLVLFTAGMAVSAIQNENSDANVPAGATAYVQPPQQGLSENGKSITNLYVYDQSGKLLNGVLVYDQDGLPLSVDPGASTIAGTQVSNIFPRQLLQEQLDPTDGRPHFVPIPPPSVSIPQDLRQASPAPGAPQNSATPPGSTSAPAPTSTPSPTTTPTTPAPPTSTASTITPGGAQTTSAPPSTPNPPAATH